MKHMQPQAYIMPEASTDIRAATHHNRIFSRQVVLIPAHSHPPSAKLTPQLAGEDVVLRLRYYPAQGQIVLGW